MGNLSKKFAIVKWFVQFFLGFLLGALAGMVAIMCKLVDIMSLDLIEGRKEEVVKLFTITLVGNTLGVVLGDLSLYKGRKFSIVAVIMAFFLGLVGYFFCCSQDSIVLWIINRVPPPVLIVIISLITYNAVSLLHRKRFAKRKPKDEQKQ